MRAEGQEAIGASPNSHLKDPTDGRLIVDRGSIDGIPSVGPLTAIVSDLGDESLSMANPSTDPVKPGIRIHGIEERVAIRCFADLETTILCSAGRRYAAVIENISENGCRAQILDCEPPKAGGVVIFLLPGFGYTTGTIAWRLKDAIGIVFFDSLASSSVNALVKLSLMNRLEAFSPQALPLANLPPPVRWMK